MRIAIASTIIRAQIGGKSCMTEFRSDRIPGFTHPEHWSMSTDGIAQWKVPAYEFIVKTLLGVWQVQPPGCKNTFISFNYDLLVEEALRGLGIDFSYGVKNLDANSNAEGKLSSHSVAVLKLHGSINWAVPKGKRTEVASYMDPDALLANGLIPELLPPTWRKDSLSTFSQIWRRALDSISTATRLVVIGFSIPPTDLHFRYLLAAGLRNNISLREIVFVDPNTADLEARSKSIFANPEHNAARVRFQSCSLESFCAKGLAGHGVASIGRELPYELQQIATYRT
jgi:hypothetical protein